ncbi:urease accessory protein UreH domain-containing protein [Lachnoclostridium phytofermentans]|uniref:Heavy metal transport/detoxification protein n=1 Tax=Lachnoclostridium phytofermentans (strain ATCC 700394 / DSM 18823 / ISDg) TaxID=357809 RepID=A9KJ73_LACP7|nr:sulfite exporter TauE/SafE family protein [Lachnoclostridium phytofermentans]ABX42485.1 Heavy metal transport/detoxification protein [Lachnoclostridium phytofermentans ISDg]
MEPSIKEKEFKIGGMTCVSCENRIESQLNQNLGIKKAEVSYSNGTAQISYDSDIITIKEIIQIIEDSGYEVIEDSSTQKNSTNNTNKLLGAAVIILALYTINKRFGLFELFNFFPQAEEGMGYGMLFIIGLLTSVHCVAMCGGINLSQCIPQATKQRGQDGKLTSLRPSLLYNLGRVISYTVIGGIVGALGSVISFSGSFKGIVQIVAGVFMVIMGLNMLNIFPWLRKLNPRMPKIFARKIKTEKNSNSPFYVGLLNGLMPCGPLQAMQLYALSTGNPLKGALSMLLFSLGTVPLMFGLGVLSSVLSQKFTKKVMTAGAVLVVVLGASMFHSGLSLSGFAASPFGQSANSNVAKIQDGVQIVNTTLNPGRYEPITVQAGIPVKWIITAENGSINGCNNRIYIREYGIEKKFEIGENVIEFTPEKAGTYRYSCWMGMIRSTITVLEEGETAPPSGEEVQEDYNDSYYDSNLFDDTVQEKEPAGYQIPVDNVVIAEKNGDKQTVEINVTESGFSPALIIMESAVETEWNIHAESLNEGNKTLLFPFYETIIPLDEGDNRLYVLPITDFDFSTIDYNFFGFVKVVDDIDDIDLDAIKEQVRGYETYKWNYNEIGYGGGGGASCH